MPWWGWVILILLGLAWVFVFAGIGWRRGIRREFIAFLKEKFAGLKVVEEHGMYLLVEGGRGFESGIVGLAGLYKAAAQPEVRTPKDRREVYEEYLQVLRDGLAVSSHKLDPERDAVNVMPRLVTREFFAEEPALAGAPNVPLGGTGLYVVYVLDGDASVVYLTRDHLKELELTEAELGATAVENLKARSPIEHLVRGAAEKGQVVSVKQLDTYDATRLLLLPDLLRDGETLMAVTPDRDTLVFAGAGDRENLEALEEMLLPLAEKVLLKRVLRVTSGGIELA